jgi:LPXTG-motif cell wall-anchored protein
MKAETAAMQQLLSEQDNAPSAGINVGKIALIGGAVILLGIGAVILLKKKNRRANTQENLRAEDLTL